MARANGGRVLVKAGTTGVVIAIAGISTGAITGATLIAATGGAAAVVLVGAGIYKRLKGRAAAK